jgi:transposase
MWNEVKPNITEKDVALMEAILSDGKIKHNYAVRIQTVLNRAKGLSTKDVALFLGINVNSVSRHVRKYNEGGIESLVKDKTRKPGTEPISNEIKDEITSLVCKAKPKDAT